MNLKYKELRREAPTRHIMESKHTEAAPPSGTDSVLIKFVKGFDSCGVFEFFSMKIKVESAQN